MVINELFSQNPGGGSMNLGSFIRKWTKDVFETFSGASITFANITLANKMDWWNYQIRITSCFDTVYCDRLNQIGE